MSFRSRGFVAAMEEDASVGGSVEMVPETAAEVEANTAEIAEDSNAVEELSSAIEEAATDAEALGDMADVMQESVDSGEGLDPQAAEIAEVAVESICARLGIKRRSRIMPSMESFGGRSTRVYATRVAIEGFKDTIKKIWDAIVSAAKRVWEFIKGLVMKLFKSRKMLKSHLEALKDKVKGLIAGKPDENKLKGGFASVLSVDGNCNKGTAMHVLLTGEKVLPGAKKMADGLKNVLAMAEAVFGGDQQKGGDAMNKFNETVQMSAQLFGQAENKSDEKNATCFGYFIHSKSFFIAKDDDNKDEIAFKVGLIQNGKTSDDGEALDKAGMLEVINQSVKVIDALVDYDKISKDIEGIIRATMKLGGHATNIASKVADEMNKGQEEEGINGKQIQNVGKIVRDSVIAIAKVGSTLPSMAYTAAKAGGDYVSASLRNIKVDKDSKKVTGLKAS